ncbi:hemerythrin domain-containing protein [Caulobacter sp.]|uniref:hemerythrin domain-containing protein n=1 Tax=Caulobacter sp. TaxID=78 RepID=UPI002B49BEB6|nr:hemerythrin domain-containing protein [Caulobacter sp.]HJV42358.1 hemerythrin domain-containing protein [Caulobacter sp.]
MTSMNARGDAALIEEILSYHRAHIADLEAALALSARVEERQGAVSSFPPGLTRRLSALLADTRAHQAREEAWLSSFVETGVGAAHATDLLDVDHDLMQEHLERLVRLTGDYLPPSEADADWRGLYALCRKYDGELREHMRLEDRVLFPRLREEIRGLVPEQSHAPSGG